ncbi:MAG TPA: SDR family oxidoreductase [Alphaproteobacteria bacterium]|nr:SDR family oxidoreductase [Alphaproteobacteria bacterium]
MPVILITGATSGFGEAAARKFAENGWQVVGTGRRADRLEALTKDIGDGFYPLNFDIADREATLAALKNLPDHLKRIDVLVNNAGGAHGLDAAQSAKWEDWEAMVDINIKGLLSITHALLPGMLERGRGHIINIGSIAGNYPYPKGNVYGASKAFVNHFSLNLKADLAGTPVRATSIEPGLAETEFSVVRFKGDQAKADSVYQGTKPLSADDIAECIWWCATLPEHVNINKLEVMPTCQGAGAFNVVKQA